MRLLVVCVAILLLPLFAIAGGEPQIRLKARKPPCPRNDLHAAAKLAHADCLALAFRHMDVNDRDADGDTPLHNVIRAPLENATPAQKARAIRFLVKNGADLRARDFHGRTPQELAGDLGFQRLSCYLQEVEREFERLFDAVENNDVKAMSDSFLRGAPLGLRDTRLDTLLHRAAQSNNVEAARLLVHHGADLEARNYLGETPLLTASLRDHREVMQLLIDAGANVNALDERRRTPLDIAELRSDPQILAMLEKKHARHGASASVEFDFDGVDGAGDAGSGR